MLNIGLGRGVWRASTVGWFLSSNPPLSLNQLRSLPPHTISIHYIHFKRNERRERSAEKVLLWVRCEGGEEDQDPLLSRECLEQTHPTHPWRSLWDTCSDSRNGTWGASGHVPCIINTRFIVGSESRIMPPILMKMWLNRHVISSWGPVWVKLR